MCLGVLNDEIDHTEQNDFISTLTHHALCEVLVDVGRLNCKAIADGAVDDVVQRLLAICKIRIETNCTLK